LYRYSEFKSHDAELEALGELGAKISAENLESGKFDKLARLWAALTEGMAAAAIEVGAQYSCRIQVTHSA
jgi:hypothetical protein